MFRNALLRLLASATLSLSLVSAVATATSATPAAVTTPVLSYAQPGQALNVSNGGSITTIKCVSATFCVGGGFFSDVTGYAQPLVSIDRSGVWTDVALTANLPAMQGGQVNSLSCVSVSFCVAAGQYHDSMYLNYAFVSVFNGTTWTNAVVGSSIQTNSTGKWASSVSCATTTFCVVGGTYTDTSSNQQSFVSLFNGSAWADDTTVATNGSSGSHSTLTSVQCLSTSFCVAVGNFVTSDYTNHSYASFFDGTTWTNQMVARGLNSSDGSYLQSGYCYSTTWCVFGGDYGLDTSFGVEPYVSMYTGSAFLNVPVAADLNAGGYGAVQSVSCASTSVCVAGGSYTDADGNQQAFVSNYDGTTQTWTDTTLAAALNTGFQSEVTAVQCPSKACFAIGYYSDQAYAQQSFSSYYDGTTWTDSEILGGLNTSGQDFVQALECSSALNCLVGGEVGGQSVVDTVTPPAGAGALAVDYAGLQSGNGSVAGRNYTITATAPTVGTGNFVETLQFKNLYTYSGPNAFSVISASANDAFVVSFEDRNHDWSSTVPSNGVLNVKATGTYKGVGPLPKLTLRVHANGATCGSLLAAANAGTSLSGAATLNGYLTTNFVAVSASRPYAGKEISANQSLSSFNQGLSLATCESLPSNPVVTNFADSPGGPVATLSAPSSTGGAPASDMLYFMWVTYRPFGGMTNTIGSFLPAVIGDNYPSDFADVSQPGTYCVSFISVNSRGASNSYTHNSVTGPSYCLNRVTAPATPTISSAQLQQIKGTTSGYAVVKWAAPYSGLPTTYSLTVTIGGSVVVSNQAVMGVGYTKYSISSGVTGPATMQMQACNSLGCTTSATTNSLPIVIVKQ